MPTYNDYPQSAVRAAKKALKHKEENGSSCGTRVGWFRANQIANKEGLDLNVRRMGRRDNERMGRKKDK